MTEPGHLFVWRAPSSLHPLVYQVMIRDRIANVEGL